MPKSDPKFVVRPATKDNANLSNQVTARNMNVDLESVATAPYVALSFLMIQSYPKYFSFQNQNGKTSAVLG